MADKINFSVIGCGRIGARHAQLINDNPQAELIAVCDSRQASVDTLSKSCGAEGCLDYQELLQRDNIDVISICTPNGLHAEMAINAAKAGKHVLCEKPMTIHVADGQRMIEAAQANKVNLFVVKQNRYNPPVAKVKELLDENRLGRLYMVVVNMFWNRGEDYYQESDWKGKRDLDGGTLYTQASHFVDLMLWYAGEVKSLDFLGTRCRRPVEFEDNGIIALKFHNGAIGSFNYTVCTHEQNMEGSITLIAEKGTVKIGGQYLNTLEYEKVADYKIPDLEPSRPANDYGRYQGSMSNHDKVIQNVIDVLNGKSQPHVSAGEALKTVRFIEDCYQQLSV